MSLVPPLDELLLSCWQLEIFIAFTQLDGVALTMSHRITGKGVAPPANSPPTCSLACAWRCAT